MKEHEVEKFLVKVVREGNAELSLWLAYRVYPVFLFHKTRKNVPGTLRPRTVLTISVFDKDYMEYALSKADMILSKADVDLIIWDRTKEPRLPD